MREDGGFRGKDQGSDGSVVALEVARKELIVSNIILALHCKQAG